MPPLIKMDQKFRTKLTARPKTTLCKLIRKNGPNVVSPWWFPSNDIDLGKRGGEFIEEPRNSCKMRNQSQYCSQCRCFREMRSCGHRDREFSFKRNRSYSQRPTAPHNTTQYLINDYESRYRKSVYSKDFDPFLTEKENIQMHQLSDVLDVSCSSISVDTTSNKEEDRMPYTFDKIFGLKEFEEMYNDAC